MLVVGDEEIESGALAVRCRTADTEKFESQEEFYSMIAEKNRSKEAI